MEDFIWKTWARVVAYVELTFSIFESMVVLLITVAAGILTTAVVAFGKVEIVKDRFGDQFPYMVIVGWMWALVALLVLLTGLQLWASLKLLSATEFGMDVYEALEKARFWRNVTFAFLVLQVLGVTVTIFVVGVVGWGPQGYVMISGNGYLFWRGSFMFLVFQYTRRLWLLLELVKLGTVIRTGFSSSNLLEIAPEND